MGTVQVFIPLSVFSAPGCILSAGDPAMRGPLPEHLGGARRPAQMSERYGVAGVSAVETRGRARGRGRHVQAGTWSSQNPCTVGGTENDAAAVENNVGAPQNIKQRERPEGPAIPLAGT